MFVSIHITSQSTSPLNAPSANDQVCALEEWRRDAETEIEQLRADLLVAWGEGDSDSDVGPSLAAARLKAWGEGALVCVCVCVCVW
jgi:hypothetical protein